MPSAPTTTCGGGGAPSPGGHDPNSAGGASARQDRRDGDAPVPRTRLDRRRQRRLDQHVDRAAARQPDVPRLLVADPVADDPRVAVAPGALDLLRRRALDAAAADRARDPPVVGAQEHGAFRPRRRAERPDDDRPADPDAVAPPGFERRQEFLHRSGRASVAGTWPGKTVRWRREVANRHSGARAGIGRGRRLPAPPDVARADAREDLAEALEAGDGAGRQEVVDVRERRPHPAGERLVAGRARERVEPDEPMAVAAEARRLGRDERRIAPVPAVRHDDDDAARPERPARPAQVELAERLADPRPARPVADGVGDAGEGAIPVAVAQQPRHPGELRPEHERLGLDGGRRRERLDEPQEQPRMALHRARRCRTGRRSCAAASPSAARPTR